MSRRAALEGLANGLELAVASVRKLLEDTDPEEWIDQARSPLGRRRHCALSRAGTFPSARKDGGRWFVRRKELDAYLETRTRPASEKANEAAELAAVLAFRAPPKPGRKRA